MQGLADIRKVKKSNAEFNYLTLHQTVAESFQNILDDDVCFESPADLNITSNLGPGQSLYNTHLDLQTSPKFTKTSKIYSRQIPIPMSSQD